MVLQSMRSGASSATVKFFLFGILLLATFGLVLTDVGGFFQGGVGRTDVARVGSEKISIAAFDRTLRRALARTGIPPAEAYNLGLVEQVLGGEIRGRLLEQAAQDWGIVVARETVAEQIHDMIQPMVSPGESPQAVLEGLLRSQGMTEGELVAAIRREMAGGLLTETVAAGFSSVPDPLLRDLYALSREKRDVAYILLSDKDAAKTVSDPSQEDLKALYEMTKERYSKPEMRGLQLIVLDDAALKKSLTLADQAVQESYDQNRDLYKIPAQYRLEQALLSDEAQAQTVHKDLAEGQKLKTAVKKATGTTAAYLGEQSFETDRLLPELKDPVLAAKDGDILPLSKTALGWMITRVVQNTPESVKAFDSVKGEIRRDLLDGAFSEKRYAMAAAFDDTLASGAGLEEVAKTVPFTTQTLPPVDRDGKGAEGKSALKEQEAQNLQAVLEAGFALSDSEISPMTEMPDGRFIAVLAKSITPKTYAPFDSVEAALKEQWKSDRARLENRARADSILAEVQSGKTTLSDAARKAGLVLKTASGLAGAGKPDSPLTPESPGPVFEATEGTPFVLSLNKALAVAVVTKRIWPAPPKEGDKAYAEFRKNLVRARQEQAVQSFIATRNEKARTGVNEGLLEKTYGTESEGP